MSVSHTPDDHLFRHAVELPDGRIVHHPGWEDAPDPSGWRHLPPSVVFCRHCWKGEETISALLDLTGVVATGGRYSMLWVMECPQCHTVVTFPATDNGDDL